MGAIDVTHSDCQVEVGQWPLHGTLFDLFSVVERESFLPRGWTLVSSLDFGDEKGITFAHVKREIGGDRMLCDKTVTVNPIREEGDASDGEFCSSGGGGGDDGVGIGTEVSEILLQVVAKVFPSGRGLPATNFTVTQIHSLSDIVTILTDSSTYSDGIQMQGERPEEDYNHYHLGVDSPTKRGAGSGGFGLGATPHVGGTISIQSHDLFRADEHNFFTEVVDSITLDDGDTDSDDVYPVPKRLVKGNARPADAAYPTPKRHKKSNAADDDVVSFNDGADDVSFDDAGIEWLDSPAIPLQRAPRSNFSSYPRSDDPDRPFQCPTCPSKFKRSNHFKDHLRVHKDECFQCPVCPFTCKLQTLFTNHMTNKHNGKGPFQCTECPEKFDRVHDLARHLPRDHKVDTGFKLSHFERNERYTGRPGRPRGSASVTNGERTTPPTAAKSKNLEDDFDFGDGSYEDMQRLMRLYDSSNDDSPSMVPRGAPVDLQRSVGADTPSPSRRGRPPGVGRPRGRPSRHDDDADAPPDPADAWVRQYFMGCRRCGIDDLGTEQQFSQHFLKVHNDDRPYKCQDFKNEGCTSAFRMRTTYKEHIRGVHNPEIKHFKCKSCPKRYSTRSGLTQHTLQHSQFRCPVCRMKFLTSRAMTRHMEESQHYGDAGGGVAVNGDSVSTKNAARGARASKSLGAAADSPQRTPTTETSNAANEAPEGASPILDRSVNDVDMTFAEDVEVETSATPGVKSLEDEMIFGDAANGGDDAADFNGAVVFPDMQQHPRLQPLQQSVFPGAAS